MWVQFKECVVGWRKGFLSPVTFLHGMWMDREGFLRSLNNSGLWNPGKFTPRGEQDEMKKWCPLGVNPASQLVDTENLSLTTIINPYESSRRRSWDHPTKVLASKTISINLKLYFFIFELGLFGGIHIDSHLVQKGGSIPHKFHLFPSLLAAKVHQKRKW